MEVNSIVNKNNCLHTISRSMKMLNLVKDLNTYQKIKSYNTQHWANREYFEVYNDRGTNRPVQIDLSTKFSPI